MNHIMISERGEGSDRMIEKSVFKGGAYLC